MAQIYVSAEGPVGAPAHEVYNYIADYDRHHGQFLPDVFSDLKVEAGGRGHGTIISFKTKAAGRTMNYRMHVVEPEPGHVLKERDVARGQETTFTVTPMGSTRCHVRIETRWPAEGISGLFERLFAPRLVHRLFQDELRRLDLYARSQAVAARYSA
jgi:hypothetical protein